MKKNNHRIDRTCDSGATADMHKHTNQNWRVVDAVPRNIIKGKAIYIAVVTVNILT